MAFTDRTGYKSGRLTVISEATRSEKGMRRLLCQCDCGNEVFVLAANLLKTKNPTQSCGCLQREKAAQLGRSTSKERGGDRVGRLVAISRIHNKGTRVVWRCHCDCGSVCDVASNDLREGRTTSCGCLQAERTAEANASRKKHGHASGKKNGKRQRSPEYRSWASMKNRCHLPTMPNFHLYGGRGISICDRWLGEHGFENFLSDMGPRPEGQTLDRVDTNGNYEPSNCKWSTLSEQAHNRRDTPEYRAIRLASLDRGRARMWSDPEIRERLRESRRKH